MLSVRLSELLLGVRICAVAYMLTLAEALNAPAHLRLVVRMFRRIVTISIFVAGLLLFCTESDKEDADLFNQVVLKAEFVELWWHAVYEDCVSLAVLADATNDLIDVVLSVAGVGLELAACQSLKCLLNSEVGQIDGGDSELAVKIDHVVKRRLVGVVAVEDL